MLLLGTCRSQERASWHGDRVLSIIRKKPYGQVGLVCTVHDSWICDKIIKMKMEITLLITKDASFDTAALLRTSENTCFRLMFYKRNERCDVHRAACQNGKVSERRQWRHWFFWSISPKLPLSTWPFPRTFGAWTAERWSGRETSLRWCAKSKGVDLHVKLPVSAIPGTITFLTCWQVCTWPLAFTY